MSRLDRIAGVGPGPGHRPASARRWYARSRRGPVACLLLVACLWLAPVTAQDQVSREAVEALEAYAAYKMAQYTEAYRRFLALAGKGNIQGMLNVANMLQAGQGIGRDEAAALEWYRKAADRGSAIGMFYTGRAYQHGRGTAVDPERARFWLHRAAMAGSSEAQLEFGKLLLRAGEEQEAREWIGRAARDGDSSAARFLAGLDRADGGSERIGATERALIDDAWAAIDRAAQHRNAPGTVHYLAHGADIRLRLPGSSNWIRMKRRQWQDFWQRSFDRASAYSMQRGPLEYRLRGDRIQVASVIEEKVVTDAGDERLRLEEVALVRITNDRVVIERLSVVIERR